MTPLFPNPDHYKFNLIAMTSPEAKRLWRRAIKEYFDNTCIYCGITHDINDLTLDHVHPRHLGGKDETHNLCLLYTSPSPRDRTRSRMPSSA